jgi:hypothetical protein
MTSQDPTDHSILPGEWRRDTVSFPISGHPFLSGHEKFQAMLEVTAAVQRVDYFLFTSWKISPRG